MIGASWPDCQLASVITVYTAYIDSNRYSDRDRQTERDLVHPRAPWSRHSSDNKLSLTQTFQCHSAKLQGSLLQLPARHTHTNTHSEWADI